MSLDVKKDFRGLHQEIHGVPLVYLDSAATAQKPQCVVDEMRHYYERITANVHRGAHFLSEQATLAYEDARNVVARFIGAQSREIIFVRNTTEAINLVAHSLGKIHFQRGDEIIVTEMEHHSNIVPWVMLAEEKGLRIRVVPILDDGSLDNAAYVNLFNERTKLAAFSHASNALGTVNPIASMIETAKHHRVPTLIDGAQGIHHLPVNVSELDVDFYCFSGHKAYGPTGIGVLYMKDSWQSILPPYQGGGDMIKSVSFDRILFAEAPQKFEAGTPNIAGALGLKAALQYINEIGLTRIADYEASLLGYATSKMRDLPHVRIVGDAKEKVSLISFVIKSVHPHDVSTIFDREGVAIRAGHLCAEPVMKRFNVPALSRASMAFYNTHDDIDRFIAAFARIYEVFRL